MAKKIEDKQAENGLETVEDAAGGFESEPERLRAAAAALRGIIEEESVPLLFPRMLLIAFCVLIERSPETSEQGWESRDLVAVVADRFGRKDWAAALKAPEKEIPDRTRRLVLPHWKGLLAGWDNWQEGIEQRLQVQGVELRPVKPYKKGQEGGRGKSARYFLRFNQSDTGFSDRHPEPKGVVSEVAPIRYFTDESKTNSLLRLVGHSGLFLGGWGGRLFLGSMLAIWIGLAVLAVLFLIAIATLADSARMMIHYGLMVIATIGIGWVLLGWAMRLVEDRCALAPGVLQLFSPYSDCLLELRPCDGVTTNSIYLVRYTATCSICGGTVHIESGRREFSGRRLVGRCRKAPNAHIFSFDHETRWGRFLR